VILDRLRYGVGATHRGSDSESDFESDDDVNIDGDDDGPGNMRRITGTTFTNTTTRKR